MRHLLAAGALGAAGLLALAGCAADPAAQSARNPYHECRQQGVSVRGAAFERCIAETIAARCGGAEAAEEARCARRLRDTVLVTDTLERGGYRIGFDQLRLN